MSPTNETRFMDVEEFEDLLLEWNVHADKLTWDGSVVDSIYKDEVIEFETEIRMLLKNRINHGLELTDEMREFKGLAEFTRERIPELIQQYEEEPKDDLPGGCPPVEPVEDWNGSLYTLADELFDEWKRKKSTSEFKWCKNVRMNYFKWCSYHWTYENGRIFSAKSLQTCFYSAKTRDKL